jgi:putative ABC transport system substrate-binding protein
LSEKSEPSVNIAYLGATEPGPAARQRSRTAKARLPTVFQRRENVEAGGLASYGSNVLDQLRHAGVYVDKILQGAHPVEQPTKLELVINQKTAKALGIVVPPALLARADNVIE